ncbi:MAG: hypothetical protein IE885_04475 [Campylobacterales bacterium]|nr:hypothetical protein [Campylobacterales bacterium]
MHHINRHVHTTAQATQSVSGRKVSSKNNNSYLKQELSFSKLPIFFPAGLEKFFLMIYFIILPYLAGMIFLFFYISKGNYKIFLSLNGDTAFIMTWSIGYQLIASLILLMIIKNAISFNLIRRS